MATIFKPYDLFYYERENKNQTRCVESFGTQKELLDRVADLKAIQKKHFVIPGFTNLIGEPAKGEKDETDI
jgi:hypothetical protein